ncbi:STAS domain-containing protein [Streptomyces sp. NPDC012825]|uniref:STAS domain-containing protein n=1 Tax=Streptomyces sp. NPDC012825 TaxID=3364851 RepID=UPI0036B8D2B3
MAVETPKAEAIGNAAAFPKRRREQAVQRWAELPLLRTVFTVDRDKAVETCRNIVDVLVQAAASGRIEDLEAPGFDTVRERLGRMPASGRKTGRWAGRVADEVTALKQAARQVLAREPHGENREGDPTQVPALTELPDTLRPVVTEATLTEGREVIVRQCRQTLETATSVIEFRDRAVAVPLIGTLDSARDRVVTEILLRVILEQRASRAVSHITGVPAVGTLVARCLTRTVVAGRLMGAACVIPGIRPVIAQTVARLDNDLGVVTTRATPVDALSPAPDHLGGSFTPLRPASARGR